MAKSFFELFQREIIKRKEPTQALIIAGRRILYHMFTIMKNRKPYRQKLSSGKGEGPIISLLLIENRISLPRLTFEVLKS